MRDRQGGVGKWGMGGVGLRGRQRGCLQLESGLEEFTSERRM